MMPWLIALIRRQPLILPALSVSTTILLTENQSTLLLAPLGIILALLLLLSWCSGRTHGIVTVALSLLAGWLHWNNNKELNAQLELANQRVELLCIVKEEPTAWREIPVEVIQGHDGLEGSTIMLKGGALYDKEWHVGEKVWLKGQLKAPVTPLNPDLRDEASMLRRKGISLLLETHEVVPTNSFSNRYFLPRWSANAKSWVKQQLINGIENTPAEKMVLAVFLGEKPTKEREMMHDFRVSGTMHIFAVSGLHVILVGCIIALVLRLLGAPSWVWIPLVISTMFFYAVVTGMRPPAMRAVLMASVYLLGVLVLRKSSLLNSLWLSAIVALLWNGHALFMPSFQFSYAVLIMIALTVTWFSNRLKWITYTDPFLPTVLRNKPQCISLWGRNKLARATAISGAAWCGSAPLAWIYFGIITPLSIVASVPLVGIVFLMLSVSCLSLLLGFISPDAQSWVNQLNAKQANVAHFISNKTAEIPYGHYQHQPWSTKESVVVYQIPEGGMAIYLNIGGGVMLDAGSTDQFYQQVYPSFRKNHALLDTLIITHADSKHSGGMIPCIERYPIKQVMLLQHSNSTHLRKVKQLAKSSDANVIHPLYKKTYTLSTSSSIQILSDTQSATNRSADDKSLVILLEWNDKKILFLSDAGFAFERWWIEHGWDIDVDAIVMGKHAKEHSLSPDFLMRFKPETIIATHANYPEEQAREGRWIERIQQAGITLHLLNQSGAITLTEKRGNLTATSFRK
eukprot:Seg12061.2 transcript_id=Seg12061.2/GoldUCD/mRNA.D3Y31 product="ComE operon protein 3" protein_id=Seg12061.2/GoldUCD/D3Y31